LHDYVFVEKIAVLGKGLLKCTILHGNYFLCIAFMISFEIHDV